VKEDNNNKGQMVKFSPALGLIFGVPIGALFGIILNNIALFAGVGAGLGLIVGAIMYSFIKKN
jgi:F0F1-type ATP synthase assembly protein I